MTIVVQPNLAPTQSSKRERILQAFEAVLVNVNGIDGRVFRTLPDANARELQPYVGLEWSSEQSNPMTVPQLERTLTVQVSVYVRGETPDLLADPIAVSVHSVLMADPSLGGLAIDTMLKDATFESASADQSAGKLTHQYEVIYRHSYADMTA